LSIPFTYEVATSKHGGRLRDSEVAARMNKALRMAAGFATAKSPCAKMER
jgi:hypothetical protein